MTADELRRLSTEATPGPWHELSTVPVLIGGHPLDPANRSKMVGSISAAPDADLIMWCRNHVAALADLIDAAHVMVAHAAYVDSARLLSVRPKDVAATRDALAALEADR